MKKLFFILTVLLLSVSISGEAQSVKSILKAHYAAIGQSVINKADGAVMTGKINQMGMELPFSVTYKKPGKVRFEASFQEMKIIQAYDGKIAWMINPMTGGGPTELGISESNAVKDMGEFEGRLYNWKKKGYKVTYVGEEDFKDAKVYKIHVVMPDQSEELYFINTKSYLVEKIDSKSKIQGLDMESTRLISDYRNIDGALMPFKTEIVVAGQGSVIMEITEFIFKSAAELEDSFFAKPVE